MWRCGSCWWLVRGEGATLARLGNSGVKGLREKPGFSFGIHDDVIYSSILIGYFTNLRVIVAAARELFLRLLINTQVRIKATKFNPIIM